MNFDDDFKRIGDFDISDLLERSIAIEESVWAGDEFRQEKFEAHKHTQTIKLIMDEDGRHRDPTVHPFYHEFQSVLAPIEQFVRSKIDNTLKAKYLRKKNGRGYFIRMILVNLKANGVIRRHIDTGESLLKCHRMHLPVLTNELVIFSVGDSDKHLQAGELWEINNRHIHGVVNNSGKGRIHLIMDYVLPGEKVTDVDGSKLIC